ncbi:MAG TPA: hypothetical protein VFZ53_10950 [Polyangiaceae bacterium]
MRNPWLICFLLHLTGCHLVLGLEETTKSEPSSEERGVSDVALGENHGCAIWNARVYCWGDNTFGQLGVGGTEASLAPQALALDGSWSGVAAGTHHSCALDERGRVACWGSNDRGQLGTGDRDPRDVPEFVDLPERARFVTTHFSHTCALLEDSTLHCWGKNDEGELGQHDELYGEDPTVADALGPVAVPGSFRAVDAGQGHTCAIRDDGALFGWGRNSEHELGEAAGLQIRVPIQIGSDDDWLAVEAGQDHTCALRGDLSAHCWGYNTAFEENEGAPLGIAGATLVTSPRRLPNAGNFTELRSDTFHTCAIDVDTGLSCWGRNVEGQLGVGDRELRAEPVLVSHGYVGVAVGRFSTCAIGQDATLGCAGKNDVGQLGTGDIEDRERLTPVTFE